MMEIYGLLAASILTISLGVISLFRRKHDRMAYYFFASMIGTSLWAFGIAVFLSANSKEVAQYAAQLYYSAAALIALTTTLVGMSFGRSEAIPARVIALLSVPFIVIVGGLVGAPQLLMSEITIGAAAAGANTISLSLVPYVVYGVYFLTYFGIGIYAMVRRTIAMKRKPRLQARLGWVAAAYIVAGMIGAWFNLILPWLGEYEYIWVGPLGLLLFVPIIYVAIVKYGLFDVRMAVSRTVVYGLTLAVLASIYVVVTSVVVDWLIRNSLLPAQTARHEVSAIDVLVTLGLVFLFQPIRQFFDKVTNKIFYRNRYDKDEFYESLSGVLTSTTNLRPLLERISRLFVETFGATHVFFFVYRDDRYVMAGSGSYSRLPVNDARWLDDELVRRDDEMTPVFARRLADDEHDAPLRRFMVSHKLAVIVPLLQGGVPVGYVCMGERRGGSYEVRDEMVLRAVSDELVIAIQNALSIQEVRDLNETLQQRIDDATKELRASNAQLMKLDQAKDDFISMASHQLRTPLTSIKGYIDMMLDGDAGRVTPMQKRFLTEAFVSSERMVHLINDFLNVSRLQTGKFVIEKRPVNLVKVIEQELESLRVSAGGRDLKFTFAADKTIPRIMLDEAKIRQVIMNFSDNALYYSELGSTIKVSLRNEDGDVVFRVEDTGIGVPKAEQARLFTKFFRATNARRQRPDGTGVGLYLAKRVIAGHGGSIVFSSTEGKGSVFGFRLPLKRLGVRDDAN